MLVDTNGRRYWRLEIFFSPKNVTKVIAAFDKLCENKDCELKARIRTDGHIYALSYRQQDIQDLALKIAQIELQN